ncbi:hypothetical protein GALL_492190 [mine drainage metagenome]|uniref:Uncharacterized protein n=1 Tax=mine drainage metagenome TaxID=410659 RepID=A0A1J5PN47_9ZZZZ
MEYGAELQIRFVVLRIGAAGSIEIAIDPHQLFERAEIANDADAGKRGFPLVGEGGCGIDTQLELTARAAGAFVLCVDFQYVRFINEGVFIAAGKKRAQIERPIGHLHEAFPDDIDFFFGVGQLERVRDVGENAFRVEALVGIGEIGLFALEFGVAGRELRQVEEQFLGAG